MIVLSRTASPIVPELPGKVTEQQENRDPPGPGSPGEALSDPMIIAAAPHWLAVPASAASMTARHD
eukprot:134702-Hanusia_phi.AAC.1